MLQGMVDSLLRRFYGRTECNPELGSESPADRKAEATGNPGQGAGSGAQGKTANSVGNEKEKVGVPPKKATVLIMVAAPLDFQQVGAYSRDDGHVITMWPKVVFQSSYSLVLACFLF